jgi:DNA-binding response OmpR family regulator
LAHNSLRLATPDFILLYYFVANRGNVGSRSEVIHQVWGKDGVGGELLLDSTLARLQERIGFDLDEPEYVSGRDSLPVVLPAILETKFSDEIGVKLG